MARTVVYDNKTYEPITVAEVPSWFLREIEAGTRGRQLYVPIFRSSRQPEDIELELKRTGFAVRLDFEPIYKDGKRFMWLATTADGESSLLLRAAFLPGQNAEVQDREQRAFFSGIMAAIGA